MIPYVGNAAYCYADSTAMLLAAAGEQVSNSTIEVLCGVGLGAMWSAPSETLFFGNLASPPDVGISRALALLGFRFTEHIGAADDPPPFEALRSALVQGPVVLGPVDMGYLRYNPSYPNLSGGDHFVLAYRMDEREIGLHDPGGFPYVTLPLDELALAWKPSGSATSAVRISIGQRRNG